MKLPLKYFLPLFILLIGLLLMGLMTFMHMDSEEKRMIKRSISQAKLIGSRLSSRISSELKESGKNFKKLSSLLAPYMADNLDHIAIYDQKLTQQYESFVSSRHKSKHLVDPQIARKVLQEQFSQVEYHKELHHIIIYAPLEYSLHKSELISRNRGFIYLLFDVSADYEDAKDSIISNALMNMSVIAMMVILFSWVSYYFVFRRLDILLLATQKMTQGDFEVRVANRGGDELTQVIETFNTMAAQMHTYKINMEVEVANSLKEHTEQSKMLIHQSRLASMGEMIGNIAHQWRQPLNALTIIIQKMEIFFKRGQLDEERMHENVTKSMSLISKMSSTIDDFRDFFKPDKEKDYFNLKDSVFNVLELLDASLKHENIDLDIKVDSWCEIYGFKNEFSQVLINLLNNSKDAFSERNIAEKKIKIRAKMEKGVAMVTLSDNAGGIPEGIIDRIFEPYYTTKEEGKGTGIGLYMSKMIVEDNMDGMMFAINNEEGAEFTMIFKGYKS